MGPFEQQVESILAESERIFIQRTASGYRVHGWNKAGKPVSIGAGSQHEAETIKREIESGKR